MYDLCAAPSGGARERFGIRVADAIAMCPRWTLLLVVASCGGRPLPSASSSGAGTVTISFAGVQLAAGPLDVGAASIVLKDVSLYGDVQAAPSFQLPDVSVDVLSASTPVRVMDLPQGLYSRLRFSVDQLHLSGKWRDWALSLTLDDGDDDDQLGVALRAPNGVELASGQTVGFAVTIDVSSWFAGVDLDDAEVDSDQTIHLDDDHNGVLMSALITAVPSSFALTDPAQ